MGKVPLHLGCTPQSAEVQNGKVHLKVRAEDGSEREIITGHVIAATGYKVDLERLQFLSPKVRSQIQGSQPRAGAFVEFRIFRTWPLFRRRFGRE